MGSLEGPSERLRQGTLDRLQRGYARGVLHTDAFAARVDRALRAESQAELRGLTADLEAGSVWARLRTRVSALSAPPPGAGLLTSAPLAAGRLRLGRSSACELRLADDSVSRYHAELCWREGTWYLVDLGSTNGTWVNGRRVGEAEVVPGDEIQLGAVRFRL